MDVLQEGSEESHGCRRLADASNVKHLFRAFEYLTHCYIKAAIMSLHDKYNVNCITNV